MEISVSLVEELICEQFPEWSDLPIHPVEKSGWDNRTFHLGDGMLVRMPSAERYTHQVKKEQGWLPKLGPQLSVPIPTPLALGHPSKEYPWDWSVYEWIDGENADSLEPAQMNQFASDIADFLLEFQNIDSSTGPTPDPFYRGAPPFHYDAETKETVKKLRGIIPEADALATWEKAIESEWQKDPVWVHGDFSPGNILVKDGKLAAVIDFGSCCVGDPACDLVIAWTLLTDSSRKIFKKKMNLDEDTWSRARGWALWKALITLVDIKDKSSSAAAYQKKVIDLVIGDFSSPHT